MESLTQNKPLLYSIILSGGTVLALALGIVPELAAQFEIIAFPPDVSSKNNGNMYFLPFFLTFQFRTILVLVLIADFFFSFLVDRICLWLCGEGKLSSNLIQD